jgi:thiol:disulfide interchange protein DsbD
MIPLTVSFFTKRSETKSKGRVDAFFYAFSIVFIYFLISVPFLVFDISPDTLNEISTGAPLNVVFFVIFVIFAFSFFGFYEITLPNFIANKADSASNVGGFIGIFFMAVTLAIVSFSCTGPILGSLLVGALSSASGKLNLVAGMTSFGLALALPFGVFALFPSLMKSLPKSGGWLNTVKVVLGFVELIFAVKFLSNADLVAHWGILKREVFLGLWVVLGAGLFVYLIGKIKFPHDSPVAKLSPVRITTAIFALLFTVYSAYGIPGNDLKLFSGFPPPKFYSLKETKLDIEVIHNDYEAALAKAKAENKPLMIDFTGWACVNCRKMEENVWTDLEVMRRLNEKYVVVSLYVDDKKELPESEQVMSDFFKGKKIKTLGNKYSEMQAKYFGSNSQPFYALVSPDEKLLNEPRGYTPDVKEYLAFLDCGISSLKETTTPAK